MPHLEGLEIPWQELSTEALAGLIEEFITREGTDYGEEEVSHQDKIEGLQRQIRRGEVRIVYDPERASATLMTTAGLARLRSRGAVR